MDVINCTSSYHAWEKLQKRYNRVDEAAQMRLDTELVNIRINSKQSIEEFETKFMDKVGQYKMAGGIISDGQIKNRYIQALSDRYADILKYAIISKQANDVESITQLIQDIEIQFGSSKDDTEVVALNTGFNKYNGNKFINNTNSITLTTKKFDGRSNSSLHKNQCRYCKQMGHWAKDCPVSAAKETLPKSRLYVSRLLEKRKDSSDTGDFVNMHANEKLVTNDVILNSAATNHMTGDTTKLVNITPYHPPKFVQWCDGSKLKVLGFADMELQLSVNCCENC